MKDATINIKLSKQLYDRVKEEAEKYGVTMAAFVRATLAKQIFGANKNTPLDGYTLIDPDGAFIFELAQPKERPAESVAMTEAEYNKMKHGEWCRRQFEAAVPILEKAAKVLTETKRGEPYTTVGLDGKPIEVTPGYLEPLYSDYSTDYSGAQNKAEVFFTECYTWMRAERKVRKMQKGNDLPLMIEWYLAAAKALKQKLEKETGPQFWIDSFAQSLSRGKR